MATDRFYDTLPRQTDFAALIAMERFAPVPEDWLVGCTDIVDSTAEIARGRYKTVNMVGAAVIAGMANALGRRGFPFVFGGDGAAFAVPAADAALAAETLAATRRWAAREFGLRMRAALVPVAAIRAAGRDLRLARFAPSPGADYAMFAGGGLAWAEARMKAGAFAVAPGPQEAAPDLTGLSCRWSNLKAQNGIILSLVLRPAETADPAAFLATARAVLEIAESLGRGGHPVPETGPRMQYPPPGLRLEAQASHGRAPLAWRMLQLLAGNLLAFLLLRFGLPLGRFDPGHYRAMVSANADFRKFDDGLKLTLDCDPPTRDRIRDLLDRAEAQGIARYGLFEQQEALMTCFVPSAMTDDHVHFVDGAAGGYTRAAERLKAA